MEIVGVRVWFDSKSTNTGIKGLKRKDFKLEATYDEVAQIVKDKLINKTEYRSYEELSEALFGEGNCFNESEVRKRMYGMKRMIELYEQETKEQKPSTQLTKINNAKRELEQAKVQFRDERNAWNKQNAIEARVAQKLDYLEEVLREDGEVHYPTTTYEIATDSSDKDLLVLLSDLHVGQTFNSGFGQYDSKLAFARMGKYAEEVIKIGYYNSCQNCYVSILGDLISGSIHKSIQVTNRENVIEQVKIASKLITNFVYALSSHFEKIVITNVSGNHSRLERKEDALHDERLDDLIGWIVTNSLSHLDNVQFIQNNIDIGIASFNIRGNEYISVHGDSDAFTSNGVSRLCMMIKRIPYAILYGHLHHCSVDEFNGIKMIRGGSLAGSGDSYTIEKRLNGKPSQMVCVCSERGVNSYHVVEFD